MGHVLSVRGFSKIDGKQMFYLEPFWWKWNEFKSEPTVKEVLDAFYLDYEATLSPEELRQIHERFKQHAQDNYQTEERQNLLKTRIDELDWATGDGASQFSYFIAGLYEWDSGM